MGVQKEPYLTGKMSQNNFVTSTYFTPFSRSELQTHNLIIPRHVSWSAAANCYQIQQCVGRQLACIAYSVSNVAVIRMYKCNIRVQIISKWGNRTVDHKLSSRIRPECQQVCRRRMSSQIRPECQQVCRRRMSSQIRPVSKGVPS